MSIVIESNLYRVGGFGLNYPDIFVMKAKFSMVNSI